MGKYKIRISTTEPVLIDALQFDGTLSRWNEIQTTFPGIEAAGISYNETRNELILLNIATQEGSESVSSGDYIVKGPGGNYFPCKPDIFGKTYEAVE